MVRARACRSRPPCSSSSCRAATRSSCRCSSRVYFVGTTYVVENGRHGIHKTTLGSLYAGMHEAAPRLDRPARRAERQRLRALDGRDAVGLPRLRERVLQPQRAHGLRRGRRGAARPAARGAGQPRRRTATSRADGKTIHAQYVLAPDTLEIAGTLLKDDGAGVGLYRVNGPIVILTHVSGIYPNDTWSGKLVDYQRVQCTGGTLAVAAAGRRAAVQDAADRRRERGRPGGRPREGPGHRQDLAEVPLRPSTGHVCARRLHGRRTLVPAKVEPGSTDTRAARRALPPASATRASEDRLRRLAALARADGREQLHPRLARRGLPRRPGRGGHGRRVRADLARRAERSSPR